MSHREPLPALTGLRGIAALWVVLFHVRGLLSLPPVLDAIAGSGYLAVDVFFMLSGFVLAYQYGEHSRVSWRAFVWRRFARIAPLHVAITLGLVIVVLARGWWSQEAYAPQHLVAHLLLVQAWSPAAAAAWNEPSWSVSAEWFAYLIFPVLVATVRAAGPRAWLFALTLLLVPRWMLELDVVGGPLLLVRLVPAVCAGVVLAGWHERGARLPGGMTELAAVAMCSGAAMHLDVLVIGAGATFVFGLATGGGPVASVLGGRPFVWLGEMSYALYLVHGAAMLVLWKLGTTSSWVFSTYLVVILVGSYCAHHAIEVPARRALLSFSRRHPLHTVVCDRSSHSRQAS